MHESDHVIESHGVNDEVDDHVNGERDENVGAAQRREVAEAALVGDDLFDVELLLHEHRLASEQRPQWTEEALVDLRKRRVRDAEQVTLLEGRAELALALEAGVVPREVYYAPALVRDALPLNALERARDGGTQVISLSESAFRKASYRDTPDGWLAVVESPVRSLAELPLRQPPLTLVCEAIEKPGNLGAMLRTAEAVGADAVVAASPIMKKGRPFWSTR